MKNFSLIVLGLLLFFTGINACIKKPVEKVKGGADFRNWMQDLMLRYPKKHVSLKDICLPKAHDAGMYELNNCFIANACNVQTQSLNMTKMLEVGIRVFDIRPTKKGKKYFTYHKTKCKGIGCNGANLKDILEQTKSFLDKHNELVILEITHFCKTSADDPDFLNLLETTLGDRIYKEQKQNNTAFIHRNLKDILNNKEAKGKVVLLMNTLNQETENQGKGFFSMSFLPFSGTYANQFEFEKMETDQLQKFKAFSNKDELFEISWTLTLDTKLSIQCYQIRKNKKSIENLAKAARHQLKQSMKFWRDNNWVQQDKIPNIINIDYAEKTVTIECLKLSDFNLSQEED